jgi:hypothetical protein
MMGHITYALEIKSEFQLITPPITKTGMDTTSDQNREGYLQMAPTALFYISIQKKNQEKLL